MLLHRLPVRRLLVGHLLVRHLPSRHLPARPCQGVTLIELLVVITLLGLLLGLAMPSFATWTRAAQVRTASDALQTGLRHAQAEAVRLNRQVVFFRTGSTACNNTINSSASGNYWALRTVPLLVGEDAEALQCGALTETTANVGITGPEVLCFNSAGRQTANGNPGVGGAACTVPAAGTNTYVLTAPGSDRTLNVTVSLGGRVRMCLVSGAGTEAC